MSAGMVWLATSSGTLLATPSDSGGMTATTVTPGLPAFIVMFVLAAIIVLLALDMTRRVRRIQARARAEEHLAQEGGAEAQAGEPKADEETAAADGQTAADGDASTDEELGRDGDSARGDDPRPRD